MHLCPNIFQLSRWKWRVYENLLRVVFNGNRNKRCDILDYRFQENPPALQPVSNQQVKVSRRSKMTKSFWLRVPWAHGLWISEENTPVLKPINRWKWLGHEKRWEVNCEQDSLSSINWPNKIQNDDSPIPERCNWTQTGSQLTGENVQAIKITCDLESGTQSRKIHLCSNKFRINRGEND